ncbi:MAG: hypothetical protein ACLQVI_10335, partial [Polyangiaceae bacterium]
TEAYLEQLVAKVRAVPPRHRAAAERFLRRVGTRTLFEILHSMRRWYSGQTMAHKLLEHREHLREAMQLEPEHAVGVYRGFKVSNADALAGLDVGHVILLPVTRNGGVSSWSTSEAATNRFSGGGNGKTGLIVRLIDHKGIRPILAPPSHSEDWFNALYASAIGNSFRPTEGEYLIAAAKVKVEVVRVKK